MPEPRVVYEPRWKLLSNSKKAHLFINARSLCGKWGYMGSDYDGPWTGKIGYSDCKECGKRAQKNFPQKEKADA